MRSTWRADGLPFEAASAKYGPRPPKKKAFLPQGRRGASAGLVCLSLGTPGTQGTQAPVAADSLSVLRALQVLNPAP